MIRNMEWKVLLIDDEAGIRNVTAIMLADGGYTVRTAADGEEGLRICEEFAPQVVITDLRMPVMDGLTVLERVKARFPDIEVVVATAFGDMDVAVRALQLDASDFITKPLGDAALQVALDRAKTRYTARKKLRDYTDFLERDWSETLEELMVAFEFQRNLIENSMDGILGCNADHRVITFNRHMETLTGYDRKEVINRKILEDFFSPEEVLRLKHCLTDSGYGGKNRLYCFETQLIGQAGHPIPVQISAAVLFKEDREDGLVCFLRDLREIRKLEREMADQARILQQDKMMSLGRLAASVAHEINNPLSGVLNYARLMLRMLQRGALKGDQQVKFISYLELVEKETDRCSQIVSSLLTFSRKSSAEFVPISPAELLRRSILLSRHKMDLSHIRLIHTVPESIPEIRGDFNQLQQCILNLIFNAIDAMPRGGDLTLSVDCEMAGDWVSITVSDTGTGIDEVDLPRIFEPFFTTKAEGYGVGLGLSTVYGIIEHHGGKIDVASRKGKGTSFTLTLPVFQKQT